MSKIVIFIAIIALACVNAQISQQNQRNPLERFGNGLLGLSPEKIWEMNGLNRQGIQNLKPTDGQNVQAAMVSQTSSDGKTVTRITTNSNGDVKDTVLTN